ncbi:glycosyltransferase [uncultured Draconibacterium sp.]|uniref:glycosyltransferase n=1 Tax=uncultured Draconibacterium sp. TaxID=1573823 RepID=UPI003217B546
MVKYPNEKGNGIFSIILLSYYSNEKIKKTYENVCTLFKSESIDFEFIIIDDGSKDESFEIAQELEKINNNVRAFQLSRNYTSNYAVFAGLSKVQGDCAIYIPDDEQQPYYTLVEMYRLWQKGEKLIIPHRVNRDEPFLKKIFSNSFYGIMNSISDVHYPVGGADLVFMDREVINIFNSQIHPINTAIVPEALRLGFSPYFLPHERPRGTQEKSRWTFRKKIKLAKDIFFSSSSFPIKLILHLGLFFSLTAFCLIVFYLYVKIFGNNVFWGLTVPGWTSIILIISFFSGLILFSLGVISQYILLIYEEVKNRPGYIIKNKNNNSGDDK